MAGEEVPRWLLAPGLIALTLLCFSLSAST